MGELLFHSRRSHVFESDSKLEFHLKPKYLRVVLLILILAGLSGFTILSSEGTELIFPLVFLGGFILFLLLGIARSAFFYPIVFDKYGLSYGNKWFFYSGRKLFRYSHIDSVEFDLMSEENVARLSVFKDGKRKHLMTLHIETDKHIDDIKIVRKKIRTYIPSSQRAE